MDGTLLNEKKTISFKTKRYLKKLSKQGHKIVLASGRPSRAMMKYYNELGLTTPMVCYNGAYVFSPSDKNFKPLEFEFPKEIICDVISKIRPHIKNVMCEDEVNIWVDKEDKYLDKFFWYENMNVIFGDLVNTLNKNPMTCIVQTPFEYRDTHEIEKVMKDQNTSSHLNYFPAYEIINDELRDYRFYAPDMLHPSDQAVEYIWQRLSDVYLSDEAKAFLTEWAPLKAVLNHKPFDPDSEDYKALMNKTMLKVAALSEKYPNFAL